VLLIETQQDMLVIKCAISAANRVFKNSASGCRSWCRRPFDLNGGQNMLTGSDPAALVATFDAFNEVDVLGVNCAFGPPELTETVRFIARIGRVW